MTGAIQSGLRAAHEILHEVAPQSVTEEDLQGSVYAKDYKKPQSIRRYYAKKSGGFPIKSLIAVGCVALVCVSVAKRWNVEFNCVSVIKKALSFG